MNAFFILALTAANAQSTDRSTTRFHKTIQSVERMASDPAARALARNEGLNLVNVTWEDTGRGKNSAVGPNISDMTIGVRDASGELHPMPVFRFDNFRDKTADLDARDFWVRTGNATGDRLRSTRLMTVLDDVQSFLHDSSSIKNGGVSLLDDRDTHLLVSAQACFLPIASSGKASFTPVLYNYQSRPESPAVMTIVATREGTSIQVIENDNGYMSEELFFNDDGDRAPFTATRLSTFRRNGGDSTTSVAEAVEGAGLDSVLVIQVPLKHTRKTRHFGMLDMESSVQFEATAGKSAPPSRFASGRLRGGSNTETTVIGHGPSEGAHKEINGLRIERDTRFPVRVTVQFYKATSNGVVDASDVAELRDQIDRVYESGDYVGSLVTGGHTGRPTESVRRPSAPSSRWATAIETWHRAF